MRHDLDYIVRAGERQTLISICSFAPNYLRQRHPGNLKWVGSVGNLLDTCVVSRTHAAAYGRLRRKSSPFVALQ